MKIKIAGYPEITVETFTAFTSANSAQVTTVTAVADVSKSLNGKYFILTSANDATVYVVWINVDSTGVAPKIENTTNVEIAISEDDTANTIAGVLRTTIDLLADFGTAGAGADCVITMADNGRATLAHDDETSATSSTGFTFTDTTPGSNAVPANTLFEIVGKYWVEDVRWDASVTGSYKNMRFASRDIEIIVPIQQIIYVIND